MREKSMGMHMLETRKMTDIQVSDCCHAGLTAAGHTTRYYVCKKCGQPCDATWEVIIWDDGPE